MRNEAQIELPLNIDSFVPGSNLTGKIIWNVQTTPSEIVLNLFWHTESKSGVQVEIVATLKSGSKGLKGDWDFSMSLPTGPYSYAGKVFSVAWALELLIEPRLVEVRKKIIVGPNALEANFVV